MTFASQLAAGKDEEETQVRFKSGLHSNGRRALAHTHTHTSFSSTDQAPELKKILHVLEEGTWGTARFWQNR